MNSTIAQTQTSQAVPAIKEIKCTLCGRDHVHRMERLGFLENWLYSLLGFFPWRCSTCRTKVYIRARHRHGDKRKEYVS